MTGFDFKKGSPGKAQDPKLLLAAGLIYWAAAEPSSRRMSAVRARLSQDLAEEAGRSGGDLLIRRALAYVERTPFEDFVVDASRTLCAREQVCLLLNMVDCTASDGVVDQDEKSVLFRMQRGLGVSDRYLKPLVRAVLLKNIPLAFGSAGPVVDAA